MGPAALGALTRAGHEVRAGRQFVAALEAMGDRAAATELAAMLAANDITPVTATHRLLDRLA